jgi:hypothetical protein
MEALVTRLTFDDPLMADEELVEVERQAASIRAMDGFRALFAFKSTATEVVIVRVFDRADQLGRSLASGPLRPDLAEHFAAPPMRLSGTLLIAELPSGLERPEAG